MEQKDGQELLAEINEFLAEDVQTEAAADEALPFESIGDYSTDPVGFSEMSLKLMTRVETVFDLAVKYNRHSSSYLKACARLEKGIRYLGRCCITKYALQNHKESFPELGQLSTEKLYRMASFHFRKIDRALDEYIAKHQEISDGLLDMQYRYFNLMERLRSTEVKIHDMGTKLMCGKYNYDPVTHGLAFSEKSWNREFHRTHDTEAPAFHQAPALSPLESFSSQCVSGKGQAASDKNLAAVSGNGKVTSDEDPAAVIGREQAASDEALETGDQQSADGGQMVNVSSHDDRSMEQTAEDGRTMVRAQLSAAGKGSESVKEILSRSKLDRKEQSPSTQLPKALQILQNIFDRAESDESGAFIFSYDEIAYLANDPDFNAFCPGLAGDTRKALQGWDTG